MTCRRSRAARTTLLGAALALVVGFAFAQSDLPAPSNDFATLDECPIGDLDLAAMELAASGAAGTTRLAGNPPTTVSFLPRQGTLVFGIGERGERGTLGIEPPDGPLAAWAVQVRGPSGTVLSGVLAPELDFAELDAGTQTSATGESRPFGRIRAPEGPSPEFLETVRLLGFTANPIPPGCGGTAAWCAKYASRFVGPALLCALSVGADGNSCGEALDAHCAWCECKGYDCKKC
jgi:hypothetical protein